jgi:Spy/CpxP family protein refolding chaperone
MSTKLFTLVASLLLAASLQAQNTQAAPDGPGPGPGPGPRKGGHVRIMRREMGKWWQNPEIAQKLQLNDGQITQLNQVFYDHKLKLIDYGAAMEKEDLKLQTLLDADQPNESQVGSQVDQVLAARGKLEREYTMMNLDLRKVLTVDQWRQLKSIRGDGGMPGDKVFFYQRFGTGGGVMGGGDPPMPPPPPPGLD